MTGDPHAANVLGALALAVADRLDRGSDAVGLHALLHIGDGMRVDRLAQVLGLSSPGAVRLVDRLVDAGLARRGTGPDDARATAVTLTAAGRRRAAAVGAARLALLADAVAVLDPDDQAELARLAGVVLAGFVRPAPDTRRWLCRYCDLGACGRDEGRCPAANAAARAASA